MSSQKPKTEPSEVLMVLYQWIEENTNEHQTAMVAVGNGEIEALIEKYPLQNATGIARLQIESSGQVLDNWPSKEETA